MGKWVKNRVINGDEFEIKLPPNPYDLASDVHLEDVIVFEIKILIIKNLYLEKN